MFIFTAKLTRKNLAIGLGAIGVLLIAIILLLSGRGGADASVSSAPSTKGIKAAADRVEFLNAHGWTADAESEECQEVVVPREFDSVFEEYNALQKSQGFDLSKYRGKRIMRYVYRIADHPSGKSPIYASILVYKNTVIGGDIQNPSPDGFLHGFEKPQP